MSCWHHNTMMITASPVLKISAMYSDSDNTAGIIIILFQKKNNLLLSVIYSVHCCVIMCHCDVSGIVLSARVWKRVSAIWTVSLLFGTTQMKWGSWDLNHASPNTSQLVATSFYVIAATITLPEN